MKLFGKKTIPPTTFFEYHVKEVDLVHNVLYFSDTKEYFKFLNNKAESIDIVRTEQGDLMTIIGDSLKVVCLDEEGKIGKKSFGKLFTSKKVSKKV